MADVDSACVSPTKNLDMGNEGEVVRVDLDDRMIAMLAAGHLKRVDCPDDGQDDEATDFPGLADAEQYDDEPTEATRQTVAPVGVAPKRGKSA